MISLAKRAGSALLAGYFLGLGGCDAITAVVTTLPSECFREDVVETGCFTETSIVTYCEEDVFGFVDCYEEVVVDVVCEDVVVDSYLVCG